MQNSKLIALIGCGTWGKKILSTLVESNVDVIVLEVSNTNREWALESGALEYILYENDLANDISNKVDGIIVATPSTTHKEVILQLLDLELPLFIEKPLATNLKDAQSIAEKAHKDVFMMHIWQYHPGIKLLADIAKRRELGSLLQIKTVRANWTSPRIDTDTLWNFMSHDLSIFNTILGEIPSPQFAAAEKHQGAIRDMIAILGRDPICITHISNRFERKMREVRLHFADGVAVLKDEQVGYIEIIHGDDQSSEPRIERRDFSSKAALEFEIEAFLKYLDGGSPPISNLDDGLQIIETINQLSELAAQ